MRLLVLPVIAAPLAASLAGLVFGILTLGRTEISGPVVVIALSALFVGVLGVALVRAYRNPFFFPPSESAAPVLARMSSLAIVASTYLALLVCGVMLYYFHPLLQDPK